ncbi:hypothetical protein KM427_11990 [Nocardioides sp. LMS-CY]|uniref:hypothetical protein n=1 Tax=Nocardioides sp. (strain LMS-CY) TaxID=2840457 RepID=UPI001C002069|nr:hypothetical protein [Nocardioides sp. LMS-CY]QWF24346.1 hypothetical protein KM427_11990 [Nocardioides sp. LMS-CY]
MGDRTTSLVGTALLALLAAGGADAPEGAEAGPVITVVEDWNAYPAAQVVGQLREREGCLLIGGSVVFWPQGTTWDGAARAVVQVDGSRVVVGERFDGGGGWYDPATDFADLLGSSEGARRVATCVDETAAESVVAATP